MELWQWFLSGVLTALIGGGIGWAATLSPRVVQPVSPLVIVNHRRAAPAPRPFLLLAANDYQPLPVKPSSAGRALSPAEERRFVKAANSNPDWQVAYWVAVLAAHTLLSPSEIFLRQLQDIDLTKQVIFVRKGKTQFRAREVPLNAHALRAAKLLVARAKGLGAWRPEHYLLPYRARVGEYDPARPAHSCRTAWRALTRSIGLRGLRVKDMRHHGITVLDEAKTSSRVTKSLAGHSPNSRLLERYSHPRMQAKKQAVKVLERRVKIA